MIKKEDKKEFVTKTVDIICDSCGKSCKTNFGFEYMDLRTHWGYCSDKDLQTWCAQICEECVDTKLNFIKFNKETYINI